MNLKWHVGRRILGAPPPPERPQQEDTDAYVFLAANGQGRTSRWTATSHYANGPRSSSLASAIDNDVEPPRWVILPESTVDHQYLDHQIRRWKMGTSASNVPCRGKRPVTSLVARVGLQRKREPELGHPESSFDAGLQFQSQYSGTCLDNGGVAQGGSGAIVRVTDCNSRLFSQNWETQRSLRDGSLCTSGALSAEPVQWCA